MSLHETQSQVNDEKGYNTQGEVSVARLDREGKEQIRKRRRKGANEAKKSLILVQKQRQQGQTHTKHHKNITRTQTQTTKKRKNEKTEKRAAGQREHKNTRTSKVVS